MNRPTDEELKEQLQAAAKAIKQTTPIIIQLTALDAYILTAMLNLATQHPHIDDVSRRLGQDVGRRIQQSVSAATDAPPSYQLIEFADSDAEVGQLLASAFTDAPDIQVEMTMHKAFNAITLLQLVTRHPDLPGRMAAGAEHIGRQLQAHLSQAAASPEINEILEFGWHPEFDVDQDGNPIEGGDQ